MRLTINTTKLQSMVARAIKGASCNKMIPITSMMAIERKDGVVTLVTTDANNYLLIRTEDNNTEEFYAVVPAVLFSQLVAKLTCENVSLVFENGEFTVYGNGEYKIELPLDENGDFIKYPEPYRNIMDVDASNKITLDEVKSILRVNKAALATTLEIPCYTGYYVADRVISTDTYKLCGNNINVLDTPVLIAPETMMLLDVMSDAVINITVNDGKIMFDSADCSVYGNLMSGIEEYQVDAIKGLLDDSFKHSCKVVRNDMIEALDRIGLFVGQYDNHSINIQFTKDGIELSSQQSHGTEVVEYETHDAGAEEFACHINIEMLESQVKAQVDDVITIEYGKPNAIKLLGDDVVQIIALEV